MPELPGQSTLISSDSRAARETSMRRETTGEGAEAAGVVAVAEGAERRTMGTGRRTMAGVTSEEADAEEAG